MPTFSNSLPPVRHPLLIAFVSPFCSTWVPALGPVALFTGSRAGCTAFVRRPRLSGRRGNPPLEAKRRFRPCPVRRGSLTRRGCGICPVRWGRRGSRAQCIITVTVGDVTVAAGALNVAVNLRRGAAVRPAVLFGRPFWASSAYALRPLTGQDITTAREMQAKRRPVGEEVEWSDWSKTG